MNEEQKAWIRMMDGLRSFSTGVGEFGLDDSDVLDSTSKLMIKEIEGDSIHFYSTEGLNNLVRGWFYRLVELSPESHGLEYDDATCEWKNVCIRCSECKQPIHK